MNPKLHAILVPALLVPALLAVSAAGAAAETGPWRLKLSGVHAWSTVGGIDGSFGPSLGLEYRATPRLGVELGGLTAEFDDQVRFDFFGLELISETELRMTPVLGRLNVHLTPGRRVELYVGPTAGWVSMSDLTVRVRSRFPGEPEEVEEVEIPTEDQFAWGGHLGFDVHLGDRGSLLTFGVTYLDLPTEIDFPGGDAPEEEDLIVRSDLDPLIFHLGYGFSF